VKEYGFGIAGCGMIAEFSAKAISEMEGGKLVATFSRSEANARKVAEPHQAAWHTDYDSFLKQEGLDIVNITSPSGTHLDYALPAIAAGKNVIIEKPIEITLERIDRILEAADKRGVMVAGVFPSRFSEATQVLKKAIDESRFGALTVGDMYQKWYRAQQYYDEGGWKGTKALDGGGALMNQSIHGVDLIQWYMGEVDTVVGFAEALAHERIEVEDTAVAVIRYKNGAMGVIEGTTSIYPGFQRRIEISGFHGSVVMEGSVFTTWDFEEARPEDEKIRKKFAPQPTKLGGVADPAAISHIGHQRQFEDFVRALDTGSEPSVSGVEARKAVEIILAIYKSSEEGRPVKLPL
jgi:predicted dehydrogenase